MTTGPRPTPYPIVLQVNAAGTPVGIGEASSLFVSSVSAVTVSATNYLGLGSLSGYPGGSPGDIQVKLSNTTFAGYSNLKYDLGLGALLANLVSSTSVSAVTLRASTVSATNYLNLPPNNLSSLLDVQSSSVSGGQVLVYSSSINKWEPGYAIYQSDSSPSNSFGRNGDIYLKYIQDSTNAANLSSLLDTNINSVSNGQSLIWNDGYWIPSSLPAGTQGAVTSIPSASPIWNAASAEGYNIVFNNPVLYDILAFGGVAGNQIVNVPAALAATYLASQTSISALGDVLFETSPKINQTITYDSTSSRWKPGYAVFQATATPAPEIGSNGDIYFQYLP